MSSKTWPTQISAYMSQPKLNDPFKLKHPVPIKAARAGILPVYYQVKSHPQVRNKKARIFVAQRDTTPANMEALKKHADGAGIPESVDCKEIEDSVGACIKERYIRTTH